MSGENPKLTNNFVDFLWDIANTPVQKHSSMTDHKHLSPRELQLFEALRQFGGHARNAEIANLLNVSDETVRRTVKSLSKAGLVERAHGGARLIGSQHETSYFRRLGENTKEKSRLAKAVAEIIPNDATLFLDVGSTTAFISEELRSRSRLTVITNSIKTAHTLIGHNGNRVFLLGGEMQRDAVGAFGFVTERQAMRYSYDFAILSADALDTKTGFLYQNPGEAELASIVVERSYLPIVAMAHQKFDTSAPHQGYDPRAIRYLYTDASPGKKLTAGLDKWQVQIQVVN